MQLRNTNQVTLIKAMYQLGSLSATANTKLTEKYHE